MFPPDLRAGAPAPPQEKTAAVTVQDLAFAYRTGDGALVPALRGVNLEIFPGEVVAVLGPSGAGKSTLCYCLNGLIPHVIRGEWSGEVRVFGRSTRAARPAELAVDVGMVFQDFETQLFSTNVELEVAFGLENLATPPAEMRRRVAEALALVGLAGLGRREPATLSGGQKQRLAIAAVLAMRPRVLVLDEPTTDLDPRGREEIVQVLDRLRAQGRTMLVVEHETEQAVSADRVVVLEGGRVAASGPPAEILTDADGLEARGIQPLASAALLSRLGLPPALTVEDAVRVLREAGYRIDPDRYAALVRSDRARSADGDEVVAVDDVTFAYPRSGPAVRGVRLRIRRGECVAIVGHNGSGKTTLAKLLNGLLAPAAGDVRIRGRSTRGQSVLQLGRTVGYVFQNPDHQIFAETVYDEVAFGPRNQGLAEREVRARVDEALAAVGLSGREGEDPFAMTRGERQRVAVASVLATRPEVIILDEPTTGLDYREQRRMMDLVQRLNAAGHTIIMITHALWLVAAYAHRTVVMRDGALWMDGPTREVLAREAELTEAALRPPPIVRIGLALGAPLLSVDEAVAVLRRT